KLRVELENFFTELTEYVTFRFLGYDSQNWTGDTGDLGYTNQVPDKEALLFRGSECDFGCASKITVAEALGDTLADLHRGPQTPQTINQKLRIQFYLAVTICHELMHAIENAVQEDLGSLEPYFGEQALNEVGWAWEDFVFGGGIGEVEEAGEVDHTYRDMTQWPLYTTRFPSPGHYSSLLEEEEPSPKRLIFARRPAKATYTHYYLPMRWISRLQQQATWEQWEPSLAPRWLRIPRQVGVQWRNTIHLPIDPDWDAAKSSEDEWPGGRGIRRRVYGGQGNRLEFEKPLEVKRAEMAAFDRAVEVTEARRVAIRRRNQKAKANANIEDSERG
ncbi:MAG: hypothetical protein Q9187_007376, partial [Circinaria calcarea]